MPDRPIFFRSSVHSSWHIAACACGMLVGVAVVGVSGTAIREDYFLSIAIIALVLGLIVSLFLSRKARTFLLLSLAFIVGVFIGGWRGGETRRHLSAYEPLLGQTVLLRGRVAEDASIGTKGEQRLALTDIHIAAKSFQGQVWASTSSKVTIKRGDLVFLKGSLDTGFGSTAASMYRATVERVERPYPGDVARRVRDVFSEGIRKSVSEPEASLGIGYLTGQRSALPALLDEELKIAGLTHIVVASGYNLTILVGFARSIFAKISKYLSTVFAVLMIGCFMMIAGLSPSMSRAGLVAGLSLAAWYYGRIIHPFVLLPLAASITVLINPSYLWGDIGWYLSFMAFGGVIIVAPILRGYFWRKDEKIGAVKQILTDTFSAQLVTAPIILYFFGQFSSYALIANLLVLPTIPIAMLMTFVAGITGLVLPGVGEVAGWPAEVILSYTTWIVGLVAGIPGAQETLSFDLKDLILSYAIIVLLCAVCAHKTSFSFRGKEERSPLA